MLGDLGERKKNTEAGARFPVKPEIVADETPLLLVGPGGKEVNGVFGLKHSLGASSTGTP